MNCPGPEQAAAYADGRLDAAEAAVYLEHCSECDECRRLLSFLSVPREPGRVPPAVEARVISALGATFDRERTPRPFRKVSPRPETSFVGFGVAAALLVGFVGLLMMAKQPGPSKPQDAREMTRVEPLPEIELSRPAPAPPTAQPAAPQPPPKIERVELPPPAVVRVDEPRIDPQPEAVVREVPKAEEIKPEEPPRPPSHTVVARAVSELQVTDITGALSVHRKGARAKEKLSGVARLAEGDVLTAEKSASFQVEGRHPVVLAENASVSLGYVAQEQAPWLQIHSGEAIVDSKESTRWVVTDGRVAVAIKPAKARFVAARGETRLALMSLSEPIYVQPDGGQVHAIHPGEELQIGKAAAEVKAADASGSARKLAVFDAGRPRQRTIFYTSCDAADARREHFFVQEGGWWRNEGLISRERADRTAACAIGPNPRFPWRDSLVLRFRLSTNCRNVEASMRVDERKYTLWRNVSVERRNKDQWMSLEVPFTLSNWYFRRDDGVNQLVVTSDDKFDSIRFVVRQQDVMGDQKAYVVVDDIQVVEKE